MITYQFINALSDAAPQSHLIASASCTHLPEMALVAEMRESASIADTRFGCAPFARITLLPDALWQDSLTEGLLTALRTLLASPVSPELILDVTAIDDVVLAQVLRFLFNQAHRLSDLKLKKTDESAVRLANITALCLPEQQAKLEDLPPAAGHRLRHGRGATSGGYPVGPMHAAVCGGRGAKALCHVPRPALRSAERKGYC